jgi:hypothetical protein
MAANVASVRRFPLPVVQPTAAAHDKNDTIKRGDAMKSIASLL